MSSVGTLHLAGMLLPQSTSEYAMCVCKCFVLCYFAVIEAKDIVAANANGAVVGDSRRFCFAFV